ncbi:MAG: MFS transporter [Burkholderiales bacterium]|nr:MFS transporter [Burkholderiales bacterium]
MVPAGIQSVLLAYLLAIELHQPAARFGLTQMLGQLPVLVLLVFGGWLADRVDPRRLLMGLQAGAALMPLALAAALWLGRISESLVLMYAVTWGVISAFAMPARDGLLNRVAGDRVQRVVTLAMGVQFGTQMIGQAVGGQAGTWGPVAVLLLQAAVLLAGVYAAAKLPAGAPATRAAPRQSMWREIGAGLTLLFTDPAIRGTFVLICGMGVFFAGVMVVLIPLAVRDLYAGGSQDIAIALIAFGLGTLTSIGALIRLGGVRTPGRALCLSQFGGCAALVPIALASPIGVFYLSIFLWGMCGGVAMTMSRTIMQENAPASHRSRVMAAFSVASTGGAPIGSLMMGLAIGELGVRAAVLIPIAGVLLTTVSVMATHALWTQRSHSR